MKFHRTQMCLPLLLTALLPACYIPAGPNPEAPHPPAAVEPVPQRVIVEEELIFSPAPGEIPPEHRDACNSIRFVRYRPETIDGAPKPVDAVLVLIPGYMAGAGTFDYLGRQLVSMAEAEGVHSLEVWAVDRRPNCLEDLTGMNAAEVAVDPDIAVGYYYHGGEVEGRTFQGFLCDPEVPFLAEFGLRLLMEDLFTIMTTKIPDAGDRKRTVFVGGHSLGGPLTALFAGWDLDGDPATVQDGGFKNCAGLITLDGELRVPSDPMDETAYLGQIEAIRTGAAPRMDLFMGVSPEVMAVMEMLGMHAAWAPDEEATLFRELPYSPDVELMMRLLHSRDLGHFVTGVPYVLDYRYTHEALLGVFMDDNFQPVEIMQASLGFLRGGPVLKKRFPGELGELMGIEHIDKDGLFIAWDPGCPLNPGSGPLYSWVNFDEVGDTADPVYRDCTGLFTYTDVTEEVTDIQDFARIQFRGPSNFTEWYFAARLRLDMEAAAASYSAAHGITWLHGDRLEEIPKVEFMAADIPGYNHQDVIVAAVDRPDHRENEIFAPMLEFMFSHSSGSVTPLE